MMGTRCAPMRLTDTAPRSDNLIQFAVVNTRRAGRCVAANPFDDISNGLTFNLRLDFQATWRPGLVRGAFVESIEAGPSIFASFGLPPAIRI